MWETWIVLSKILAQFVYHIPQKIIYAQIRFLAHDKLLLVGTNILDLQSY